MRIPFVIGSILILAACAGAPVRPYGYEGVAGEWRGAVLRDGLREPIAVQFLREGDWQARLSSGTGSSSLPLQDVRVTATKVRFEVPGEGVFEGNVVGDSIAGSVSGPASGSFTLSRQPQPEWTPYLFGP
jgi:hypothetical protein